MQKSDSIKELAVALSAFQAEQKPIAPNAQNKFLKNKYADLTTLIENTKANLKKHGLAVSQLLGDGVTTILMHNSGEYIASTFEIKPTESAGTNPAQQMGIAITYARRYAYASILGLVTDEDTDGATKDAPPPKPRANATDDGVLKYANNDDIKEILEKITPDNYKALEKSINREKKEINTKTTGHRRLTDSQLTSIEERILELVGADNG